MLAPLAERLRPKTLDEYIGQEHLVGKGAVSGKRLWPVSSRFNSKRRFIH